VCVLRPPKPQPFFRIRDQLDPTDARYEFLLQFYLDDLEDELTTTALRMLVKDLLILFQAGNEGVINVLGILSIALFRGLVGEFDGSFPFRTLFRDVSC
jgi:hypothetical protein